MPDLYALPPEEFTAARGAAAKQARADGDKALAEELAVLRRPTLPAHLVNLLVRQEADLVTSLLELGGQLAEAQRSGNGEALRALGEQRRALVQAGTARAVELGGRDVAAAVRGEVEATLEAALADPAAGEAVRSGRLVRALSFAGFGGADLQGAVAPSSAPPPAVRDARRPQEETGPDPAVLRAAEHGALEAQGALDDAVRTCERAQQRAQQADAAREAADGAVRAAVQVLARAREEQAQAEAGARTAEQQADEAADVVGQAQEAAEAARTALDQLRRSAG